MEGFMLVDPADLMDFPFLRPSQMAADYLNCGCGLNVWFLEIVILYNVPVRYSLLRYYAFGIK